eukprot:SAG31_NODE_3240_length_4506_cov_2.792830_2_plen_133_part_00
MCEYAGEVLTDAEGDQRGKEKGDEYLFDMDLAYMKRMEASSQGGNNIAENASTEAETEEELCNDAKHKGNIGRFLNHCCEPNLAIQNVLIGHSDLRLPRIAFFAARDIPPKTELTFDVRCFLVCMLNARTKR